MWFIIEILLALSILSSVLTGIYYLIPAFNRSTSIAKTQINSINLKNALLNVYLDIAQAEQTCGVNGVYGYSACPSSPLPCNINYVNNGINFYYVLNANLNGIIPSIESAFSQAGCSYSLNSYTIGIFCPSITASNIDFCSNSNYINSYTFVNPAPSIMPSITFYTILEPSNPASPLSAPYVVDYTPIYQYLQNISLSKFEQISSAMRNYVLQRRTSEIANSCTWNGSSWVGGMESSYDFYIPWILQAYTNTPNVLCQSVSNNQVCSNSCTNITFTTPPYQMSTLLQNIGLMSSTAGFYFTDGFGNSITINPLINASVVDNHPSFSYMLNCNNTGASCPPFAGAVMELNNSATCVNTGSPYCYLQFTYP